MAEKRRIYLGEKWGAGRWGEWTKKKVFLSKIKLRICFFGGRKRENLFSLVFLGEYFGFMGGYFCKILISTYKLDFGVITSDIYLKKGVITTIIYLSIGSFPRG